MNNFLDEKGRKEMFRKIANIHNKAMEGLTDKQKRLYLYALSQSFFLGQK